MALLMGLFVSMQAQLLPEVPNMKGRVVLGGDFGLGMSGRNFGMTLAPQVGYRIWNPLEVGVRGSYSLNVFFDTYYGTSSLHCFGAAPYVSAQVYKGLFVHAEDEAMYCLQRYNHESEGKWFNSLFVGGGYRSYSSKTSYAFLLILYNLSWDRQVMFEGGSPYASPMQIRVGYCFGL